MTQWLLFIAVAFFAGSVPFGYLIGRDKGVDLRTVGSKNIGATNLGRVLGRRYFFACFFLDMLKGLIPTLVAGHFAGVLGEFAVPASQAWWWLAVMSASVLGHMYTPWLGFKGGKGVATGLGALLGVFPALTVPAVGTLAVFLVVVGLWRFISAGSVAGALTLPLWTWYAHAQYESVQESRLNSQPQFMNTPGTEIDAAVPYMGWPFVIVAGLLAVLVVYKHRANIQRLAAGTEPRIGQRARAVAPTAGVPAGEKQDPESGA